jgi:hypothetical protein
MDEQVVTILTLTDGTWCLASGAGLCVISLSEYRELCDGVKETSDLTPLAEFGLVDYTIRSNNND